MKGGPLADIVLRINIGDPAPLCLGSMLWKLEPRNLWSAVFPNASLMRVFARPDVVHADVVVNVELTPQLLDEAGRRPPLV